MLFISNVRADQRLIAFLRDLAFFCFQINQTENICTKNLRHFKITQPNLDSQAKWLTFFNLFLFFSTTFLGVGLRGIFLDTNPEI